MTYLKPWETVCPKCGNKNIVKISRITGYLSFNERFCDYKTNELKDRKDHNHNHINNYTNK